MFNKPIKKWKLWLTFGITAVIAIGLIIGNLYVENRTIITVFLVIDFLIMTFALQSAIMATFKFKPKPKKYKTATYPFDITNLDDHFQKLGYTKKSSDFGFGYIKVVGKTAYKLTFIDNVDEYLKPVDENAEAKKKESFPGLSKCTKFVGFELFLQVNDKVLERLPDYSFQGKNIYYEGFYFNQEDSVLVETNIIDINPEFVNAVQNLKKDLGILKEGE